MAEGTGSAALLRQLDRYLAGLRRLVVETATASAADRARVRAAVHYVALRRGFPAPRGERRPTRGVAEDVRVVNDILQRLGRADLVVADPIVPAAAANRD